MFLRPGVQHPPAPLPPRFPLKLAPGARHLVDQNNRPFLGLGDASWSLITTASSADVTTYLNDRSARGFNMVQVELIDNQFNWGNMVNAGTWGANANGDFPFTTKQGGGSYTNAQTQSPDFSTPNSAYWTHADAVLNTVASYGFLVHLYPQWIGNPINDPTTEGYYNALNAQSAGIRQGYGAFVAGRYGPGGTNPLDNIIWTPGGDNNPANTAVVTDIVTGIRSIDTVHLMSVDGLDGSSMINQWGSNSFFTTNNVYSDEFIGHPWVFAQCKSEYQNSSGLQSSYAQYYKEGNYEESGGSAQFVRSQSWQAMLGGCWGYFFGNNTVWAFTPGWASHLALRGTFDAQVVNRFFGARRWDLLVPDWGNAWLTNGASYTNATFASAALASDGSWGAIYAPTTESLTVDKSKFAATVSGYWLDPTTSATRGLGSFANSGSQSFTPPTANAQGDADWVLVFETTGRTVWV